MFNLCFSQKLKFEFHFHWKMDFLFMFMVCFASSFFFHYYTFPVTCAAVFFDYVSFRLYKVLGNMYIQLKVFGKSFCLRVFFFSCSQNCKTTNLWQHSSLMVAVMVSKLKLRQSDRGRRGWDGEGWETLSEWEWIEWSILKSVSTLQIFIAFVSICNVQWIFKCTSWMDAPVTQLHFLYLLVINISMTVLYSYIETDTHRKVFCSVVWKLFSALEKLPFGRKNA